jgi:transposase
MKKEFIGIDVSKQTLDLWLHHKKSHKVVKNDANGFTQLLKWVISQTKLELPDLCFCLEHTGIYSFKLNFFLQQQNAIYYMVSGLHVKRSLGMQRGKDDRNDARALARFICLHQDELTPYLMPDRILMQIRSLLSFRSRLVKQCSGYKVSLLENKLPELGQVDLMLEQSSKEIIQLLTSKIKAIDAELENLIMKDENIYVTFKKIREIKGVGLILATYMIAYTNNFQSFSHWRKFACYAGIAPFKHESGTSIKGKTRVSQLGNKTMKTLLSQAAASAIQHNPEMKEYYYLRVVSGKNKMSTLNIIRNKLVSRMFAVAKRESPFVEIKKYAA